jgi:hypothetical protein
LANGATSRISPAALAVVAVIGVPVLVGQVAKPEADKPEPTETELKVRLDDSETNGSESARLRVLTDGAVPTASAILADDGGRDPVTVRALPAKECTGLPKRRATSSNKQTEWCLELNGIADGRTAAGTVASSGTMLALTVNRREPLFPWPFAVAALGLLIGGLILVVPRWLTKQVKTALLNRLLKDNDTANVERKVEGLNAWVAARREAGTKDDALLAVLAGVLERGPPAARRARQDLGEAVRVTPLPASHGFVEAAAAEAGRRDHELDDFLKPDGTTRDVHQARDWLTALAQLERQSTQLTVAQHEIESTLAAEGECRADADAALTAARAAFAKVSAPEEADAIEEKIETVHQAIAAARERPECRAQEGFFVMGGGAGVAASPAGTPVEMLDLGTAGLPQLETPSIGLLRLVTFALMAIVTLWALMALWQSVYEPKDAFGTLDDYLALLTAAIGSGAAGAVLGLVAIWDRHSAGEAE